MVPYFSALINSANMVVCCRFEKERMKNIVQCLKNWRGAVPVEWVGATSGLLANKKYGQDLPPVRFVDKD
jgi:hypothetical protein